MKVFLKSSLTSSSSRLSLLTWEAEIFFWSQNTRILPETYCYLFLWGQGRISTHSPLSVCHMLFYWFTWLHLFTFAVHMSAAFS